MKIVIIIVLPVAVVVVVLIVSIFIFLRARKQRDGVASKNPFQKDISTILVLSFEGST